MNFNILSSSLLSYIMALSLNKYGFDNVNIRKSKLKSYGRYYSINFFSKKYLEHVNIWEKFPAENEFSEQVINNISNQRDALFKSIDLTSLLLMKNNILAMISSSLIAKSLNSSSTLKNQFIKKILNT